MSKIRAAVIFGGTSSEHETSLASAADIIDALPRDKYEVICIGITKKGRWLYYPGDTEGILNGEWEKDSDCTPAILSPDPINKGIIKIENGDTSYKRIDVIFPVLFGRSGEDGTLTGLMNMSGVPYVGSDISAAAVCMDKAYTRMILGYNGIKTSNWRMMFRRELNDIDEKCEEFVNELCFPIIVKPANFGSAAGINRTEDFESLKEAIKIALTHDDKVVVEEFIEGKELQAAVFGYDAPVISEIGEVKVSKAAYDFNDIFSKIDFVIPAELEDSTSRYIKSMAARAFRLLGCQGLARVDFYYTPEGEIIISQINAMPEFTRESMYPKLMENMGLSYSILLDKLIEQAMENSEGRSV